MFLCTVVVPLAIQAVVAHAIPPGLPTKYGYKRDIDHDALSTINTAQAAPTTGAHNTDMYPDIAGTTLTHGIPLMSPLDQPCGTTTVTHTITKAEPLTAGSDSTTTITITRTRTTTLLAKETGTGHSNITNTNIASPNGTVPYNTPPKDLKVSTDSKCGPKVMETCNGHTEGHCCSKYGYCGGTDAHCGAGCQSGFGVCGAKGLVHKNSTMG